MKLLILDENYPHLDNLMGDVFVHVRAKEYAKRHTVQVFSFFHKKRALEYEGIPVQFFDEITELAQAVAAFRPDKIIIHFYQSWMLEKIIKRETVPVIIWVHGYEALGWYRRLFNYSWYSPVLLSFIRRNTYQQFHINRLIHFANKTGRVSFVFVSDWMRKIAEADSIARVKNKAIIANPIDTKLFAYKQKDAEQRKHILLLRSFGTRKYANDVSAEAIRILSKKPFFNELRFTIIGQGQLFKTITTPLQQFKNVTLEEKAVRQVLIPDLHATHGIFLCPTRQDAQGVSMCEAMSSGLIPITSFNTAIPEFVSHKTTGYLTGGANEVADAIEELFYNPDLFLKMSHQTAASIRSICSLDIIVKKELLIIEE